MSISSDLSAAWDSVRKDNGDKSWVVATTDDKGANLVLHSCGCGAYKGLLDTLDDTRILFGGFRVMAVDDFGSRRTKLVFFSWVGDNVKVMMRAKATGLKGIAEQLFTPTHLSIQTSDRDELSSAVVEKKLHANAGAHKPQCYEFDVEVKSSSESAKPAPPPPGVPATTSAAPPPPPSAPPPPPPPPPPPAPLSDGVAAPTAAGGANALFAEIRDKGSNLAGMLKKVKDEDKLYKQKRDVNPVNFDDLDRKKKEIELEKKKKQGEAQLDKKAEPVFQLSGNRYIIKDQTGVAGEPVRLDVTDTKISHAVQISKCSHTVITVSGKVNCVALADCTKCFLVVSDVISTVQVTACKNIEVHVGGFVPCITIDKSTDIEVDLKHPEKARQVEVVTSSTAAVNVTFPNEDDAEESIERPVPEQYVTKVVRGPKGYQLKTVQSANC